MQQNATAAQRLCPNPAGFKEAVSRRGGKQGEAKGGEGKEKGERGREERKEHFMMQRQRILLMTVSSSMIGRHQHVLCSKDQHAVLSRKTTFCITNRHDRA